MEISCISVISLRCMKIAMNVAKVIPLFKKGDSTSPGNYRPISLLSFFSKLLEKIIFNRMYCFLSKNNSLYQYQFGFRKKHSTSLALLDVIDNCYTNMALGHKALGIFFDLQKAFVSVNHNILLKKLYHYGIGVKCKLGLSVICQ